MKWLDLYKELGAWSAEALEGDVLICMDGQQDKGVRAMKPAIWTSSIVNSKPMVNFLMVGDPQQPTSKRFRLVTISSNTNSFGLHNHIFVAPDGEAWQAAAYRGPGGKTITVGDILTVPCENGEPNFAKIGYEIAEPAPQGRAPIGVVRELWGEEAE
jgi:hypothetical protein